MIGEKAETTQTIRLVPTPIEYWVCTTFPRERVYRNYCFSRNRNRPPSKCMRNSRNRFPTGLAEVPPLPEEMSGAVTAGTARRQWDDLMRLLSLLLTNLLAFFLVTRVRRVVALTLIGAVAITTVAPPAKAQLGIPVIVAAAAQVIATINNIIGPLLSAIQGTIGAINGALNQFRNLWEQVVYPLQLINRARALVNSMIAQFRGLLRRSDARERFERPTANPVLLEGIIRDRGTGDFAQLTNAFGQTYRAIPQASDAHPIERDLADIDDAMALANLKTLRPRTQWWTR